jgi:glycosyltransferase involved in cell wall biosynthesis
VSGRRPSLRILMINTSDMGGGAELTTWNLFNTYRRRGYETTLAVGRKRRAEPDILAIAGDAERSSWAQFWNRANKRLEPFETRRPGVTRLRDLANWIGEPIRWFELGIGHEDFHHPGTWQLLKRMPFDIVHCFNLHGGYFDLRILPTLSRDQPVILDLCDAWLLSGHCAHSLGCDRWKTGCGQCPDLELYPAIHRDGTAFNWRRKQRIFAGSRLCVSTPSRWLMQKVQESMLGPSIVESRVIPTGVDLSIFHPAGKDLMRAKLNLPQDAKVLLFVANAIRRNTWKDYGTLSQAVARLPRHLGGQKVVLVALGEESQETRIGQADVRSIPHVKNPEDVAPYYQAADLYVHAAVADTLPRAVLEALACGTPVVASAVGGIPEEIRSLDDATHRAQDDATGVLVPAGDAEAMADAIERLLTNDPLRGLLGEHAAKDACDRFDLQKQADSYLDWYQALIRRYQSGDQSSRVGSGGRVAHRAHRDNVDGAVEDVAVPMDLK